jgi:uncharacterized protein (DUF1697 family)
MLVQQLKGYDVVNIGAAGTFVVRTRTSGAQLRAELSRRLPFETEIIICTGQELLDIAGGDPFGGEPVDSGVVRFVSVLARRPRRMPSIPMRLPVQGEWLFKILATENRFVFGQYRRHMKVIGYLGTIDRMFGVPVTTRNWNTVTAIVRVLRTTPGAFTDSTPSFRGSGRRPTSSACSVTSRSSPSRSARR